jgi:hypothetical protein
MHGLRWLDSSFSDNPYLKEANLSKQPLIMSALAGALLLSSGFALATDHEPTPQQAQKKE